MKWILSVVFILSSSLSTWAQGERPDRPEYLAQSRLLTLRVVPGDKNAKLYFAGQKVAGMDWRKDHQVLEITALTSKKTETLQFNREGDAYVIPQLPNWNEPYDLVVKSQTKGQVENIHVKIKNKKP